MRKKLISLLLTLVFMAQSLPLGVLAETANPAPTAADLTSWIALTGLSEEAAGFHPGMDASRSMNALQMSEWIEAYEEESLFYLTDIFEDYDVAMYEQQNRFSGAGFASQIDLFYSCYDKVMEHRDEVSYYHDSIVKTAGDVFTMAEALQTGSLSEKEKLVYSYQVREAANTLEDLMSEVCELAPTWSQGFEPWASEQEHEALLTLFEAVDAAEGINVSSALPGEVMSVAASAVRVAPDPMILSRLSRLAPVTSALADEDQLMKVMVVDDKYFVVYVKADGNALEGVEVQAKGEGMNAQTRTTDVNGYATFAVRDFKVGNDGIVRFDVTLKKSGYQTVHCPGLWVKKGGRQNLEMKKDVGTPYPVAWTFWGNDMLKNRYTVVTSPFNETNQRITFTLHSDRDFTMKMVFKDRNGKEVMQVGSGSGKAGEQTFQYDARYLQKVPAESKLFAEVTADGKTEVFEALLSLEAAKVTNPIGDPNTKFLTIPGLQFKLPDSWPAPLKGLVVAINMDVPDSVKVRLYIDLNGNGAITLGTSAFDDVIKEINNGLWKTQDKRTMDEAVRAAEERGRIAKAKAANGGDWAGRSRWNPFKLGNIALEMSMFGFAQVQYRSTSDKHGEITGKGGAGIIVGVGGEAGLQWPFFSITLGAKAAVTVFAEVGVRMHTYWPSNQKLPSLSRFEYIKGSLNYIIRLELSLTFAVGLKGVLSASIGGLGFLEIQIRASLGAGTMDEWLKNGNSVGAGSDSTLKVIGGASFMIIVEILWFKTTYYPFTPESGAWKWQLYPEVKRLAETGPMTMTERFIDWFLATASAEEEPEGGLSVDTANRDLDLYKKAQRVEGDVVQSDHLDVFEMEVTQAASAQKQKANVMLQLRNAEGGNHPVLMYAIVGKDNSEKLDFKRLERKDPFGPEQGYDVIDYAYWVQCLGRPDRAFIRDEAFPVQQLLFTASILAKEYEEVEIIRDGETLRTRLPVKTWANVNCYVLSAGSSQSAPPELTLFREAGTTADEKKFLGFPEFSESFELGKDGNPNGNPVIFGRLRTRDNWSPMSDPLGSPYIFDIHLITSPLRVDKENGGSGKALHTKLQRNVDFESKTTRRNISEDPVNHLLKPDLIVSQNRFFPTGNGLLSEPARAALFHLKGETSKLQKMAYIPQPGGTPVQIADRVLSMAVTDDNQIRQVFYVQETQDRQGYDLKSARINPKEPDKVIITNYDIKMPAADIEFTRLFNKGCIYWTEKTGTEDEVGNIFVVRGLWVESDESISVPFELARVEIPENEGILSNLYLDDYNTGFYTVQSEKAGKNTLTVYRFRFKLTLGLNLVGNVLQSTLAAPGSYDDMVVTYYNNGNVPLTGMDLAAYRKRSDGTSEPFETIHLDILEPKNNTITMRKGFLGAAVEERSGEKAARWEESSLGNELNHYRNLTRTSYTVSGNSITRNADGQQQKLMKPRMLMPTAYGAHNISLLIPQGWSGNQEIYLKVERLYTTDGNSYMMDVASRGTVTGEKIISVGLRNQTMLIRDRKDTVVPPEETTPVPQDDGKEQATEIPPEETTPAPQDDGKEPDPEVPPEETTPVPQDDGKEPDPEIPPEETTPVPQDDGKEPDPEIPPEETTPVPQDDGKEPDPEVPPEETTPVPQDDGKEPDPEVPPEETTPVPQDDGKEPDPEVPPKETTPVPQGDGKKPNPEVPPEKNETVIRVDGVEPEEEEEYWEMFETEITYDTVNLYTEPEDLELMTNLWEDEETQKVTISVNNRKNWADGTTPRIEAYINAEKTPTFRYELPEKVIDKKTWNLDVPVSLLTGGRKAEQVTVRIRGDEKADENGEFDNESTIQLEADTMMIISQPDDQTVPVSGNAVFKLTLEGGRKPYFYRWQVRSPGGEWADLEDQFESTLMLKGVSLSMNGNLYRCLISDASGYEMATREALLTVIEVPKSGDNAPVGWWIAGSAAALAGLCLIFLRKRKEETT